MNLKSRVANLLAGSHVSARKPTSSKLAQLFLLCLLVAAPLAAQQKNTSSEKPSTALRARQRDQERARAMATELVSSVLDIQLRQLEENKLEKLPIYAEVKSMRANLGHIVDREMHAVVELLVKAQQAKEVEREQIVGEARGTIRTVVVSLMSERQKLYKRMHLAKVAAQVRQLIALETRVLTRTRALPTEEPRDREQLTLATLEDQRDVSALYFLLLDTLTDVAGWDGPVGAGASKGLRLVKTLQIDAELRKIEQHLPAAKLADAERSEQAVIKGLRALLEVIEETQGLIGSSRETVARAVQQLIKQQELVREQTRQADAKDQQQTEKLAQAQHELQQELGQLAEMLQEYSTTEALTEQAKAAALEAEAKLFEGATPEAVQQQGQVLGALAEIEKKLQQAAEATSDKTADQLAQDVAQLEKLDQALDQIRAKQAEANQHSMPNAPAARAAEDQVAQQLQQANQLADFGTAIETRLADAQDEVGQAQQMLANADPKVAEQRADAAREASQAIDQAAAEVKQSLADARREQLAVKVGELARAAEALERAAAAEREIASAASEAAKSDGLTADEATAMAEEQAHVNEVAKDIAEGVKNTAPQAAQQLTAAKPTLDATVQQLQAAKQTPGEASKPAANQTAQSAQQATKQLEQAAAQLRKEAGAAAAQLAQIAQQQLRPVVAAKQAVQSALAEAEQATPPADAVAELRGALDKTRAAQVEQLRAAGRDAAADAQELANDIQAAARQQMAADEAAQDFAQGETNTPVAASTAEQQVAEMAAELAVGAKGAVAQELKTAAQAAEESAKEIVLGNPNKANAARQTARDALNRAMQAAQQSAVEAAKTPPGKTNPTAQEKVTDLAQEAQDLLGESANPANANLEAAEQTSEAAEKALAVQQPLAVDKAQAQTAEALTKSAEQLQQALAEAAKEQAARAKQQEQKAKALANQTLPVDAGAAVALDQAADASADAAADRARNEPAAEAAEDFTRGLERAAASLAAREQELQRDQNIAEAIARLAQEQQAARDQIAMQAEKLEQLAETPPTQPTNEDGPSDAEMAAAHALADAADKFADAQRATGEGAAEISGQNEVANQPIRAGLEAASALRGGKPTPEATAPPAPMPEPGQPATELPTEPSQSQGAEPAGDLSEPMIDLGTDFIPNSPEETARQIAGEQAFDEARKVLAQDQGRATDALTGENAQPARPDASQADPESSDKQPMASEKVATSKKGEATEASEQAGKNEKLDPSQLERDENAKEKDSRAKAGDPSEEQAARKFQEEPWFAKLPASLQKAIQAKSRRGAPRGYEERLKRYFESID